MDKLYTILSTSLISIELQILIWALIIFFLYFLMNLLLFKIYGYKASPIHNNLKFHNYNSGFGFVVASLYLLIICFCYLVYFWNDFINIFSYKFFMILTIGSYGILSIILNLWAINFLKSQEVKIKFKGVVREYFDLVEIEKEKQRKKNVDTEEEDKFKL